MKSVNSYDVHTHLSRFVAEAAEGQSIVTSKAGKPVVRVSAFHGRASAKVRRTGFMKGRITVRDDFGRMGSAEINHLFGAK